MCDDFLRRGFTFLAIAILMANPVIVFATTLEEVVVTAQCIPSKLSDTPAAVTAVTGEKLQEASITDVSQLGEIVPNLKVENTDSTKVTIRSILSNDAT